MNKKELDILERVQNSERQDKLNQWLELAMTPDGIAWISNRLDYSALDAMIDEL